MSKQDVMSDLLVNSDKGHLSASQRVPVIAKPFVSERAAKTLDIVRCFLSCLAIFYRYTYPCLFLFPPLPPSAIAYRIFTNPTPS
jgi:hypothetical protein